MKKLAIVVVILIGGGVFAGCMFEENKQAIKPKTEAVSDSNDTKKVNQTDSQKTKDNVTDIKESSNSSESDKSLNNNDKNSDVKDNIVNKTDIESSNQQNLEESKPQINKPQVEQNNSSESNKNQESDKSQDANSQNVDKNLVNNNSDASSLVRKYYQNKYPSVNQSNWSTDVIANQTIDGKSGYLVRLYDYMNSHSNNIAWILVEQNGSMYSTQAGSGPLVKLN